MFKGRGIFKEEERFLKEIEIKMTSYNIIKIAAYFDKMATYHYKIVRIILK
jgi:hypothetical protein